MQEKLVLTRMKSSLPSSQSLFQKKFVSFALLFVEILLQGCVSISKDHYYRLTKESLSSNVSYVCAELWENSKEPLKVGPYKIAVGQYSSPVFFGPLLPIIPVTLSGNTSTVVMQFAETNTEIQPEHWRLRTSPEVAWIQGKIGHELRGRNRYSYLIFTIPEMAFPKELFIEFLDPQKKVESKLHFLRKDDWNTFLFIGQEPFSWFPQCKKQVTL
jgi:hypothetical protein